MALRGCLACMRIVVIVTNLILWLAGIALLAVSIWLFKDSDQYLSSLTSDSYMYHTALYVLIAVGAVMTIVGFVGCCGALRESQCMLGIYFVFVMVIFAGELTGGIWAFLHKDEVKTAVTRYVNSMVRDQYHKDPVARKTIDALQHDLKCCGADGPSDWAYADNKDRLEAGISSITGTYTVPESCCKVEDKHLCEAARKIGGIGAIFQGVHSTGCVERLKEYMDQHLLILVGVGIFLAVAQVLALIFSIVLCCGIRDTDVSYKA